MTVIEGFTADAERSGSRSAHQVLSNNSRERRFTLTTLTLAIGAILVATGVIAYIATAAASVTALIPAFVGIALVVAGIVARKPAAHRHAIHAALAVALLGALGSLTRVAKLGDLIAGTAKHPSAIIVSTVMLVLLVAYLGLGVRSFVTARRDQSASTPAA